MTVDTSPEALAALKRKLLDMNRHWSHEAHDIVAALEAERDAALAREAQYKRAVEVLFEDDSGDLDYIKWYVKEKVLDKAALAEVKP